jgi:hypothetical protein
MVSHMSLLPSDNSLEGISQRIDDLVPQIESNLAKLSRTPANEQWTLNGQIDGQLAEFRSSLGRLPDQIRRLKTDERDFWNENLAEYQRTLVRLSSEFAQHTAAPQTKLDALRGANMGQAHHIQGELAEAIYLNRDVRQVVQKDLVTLAEDGVILGNIEKNVEGVQEEAEVAIVRLEKMEERAVVHSLLAWIILAVVIGIFVLSCGIKFGIVR